MSMGQRMKEATKTGLLKIIATWLWIAEYAKLEASFAQLAIFFLVGTTYSNAVGASFWPGLLK
jgi:hypothetical protein